MATGTLTPTPYQTVFDSNGDPVSGALINTYLAGTTTPQATYSDSALLVPNANPVVADAAGRWGAYLTPGAAYKFVITTATGTAVRTVDNIIAVPGSSNNLDIVGTAGETLTAGQAVYLSDGSGGKTAGQWYRADSGQAYSSVLPQIGMVPAAISTGASGTVRQAGQMTGLSSLAVGTDYYIGTAGTITLTAPKQARLIGRADSTSSLVMGPPAALIQAWVNDFRLTLTTAVPITTADVTAATTLYCTPYVGNRLDLPDSNGSPVRVTSAEFSIAIPATTSTPYDVFVYNNGGVATLELLAWTNDTTRATAIARTNGRYFKSGDVTRLLLGSVRTTAVSGQTEDSEAKRYLSNYYNRDRRLLLRRESTASWTYSSAGLQQARGQAANQVEFMVCVAEINVQIMLAALPNGSAPGNASIAIGLDSTTTPTASQIGGTITLASASSYYQITAFAALKPTVGRHFLAWLEGGVSAGTVTWYSANVNVTGIMYGLSGWIEG